MRTLLRRFSTSFVVLLSFLAAPLAHAQISTDILKPVGFHPSPINYFNVPYFADGFSQGEGWRSIPGVQSVDFGDPIDMTTPASLAQFDQNGFPRFLNPGQRLRAIVFGLGIEDPTNPVRPPGWPSRDTLAKGRLIVTWKGNADVRLAGCAFTASGSNGAQTGNIADGRRIYLCTGAAQSIEVQSMLTAITEIDAWLAPPDDPATPSVNESTSGTLEGQFFHPILLQRIADRNWSFIRFMDWGATNASPQQDWIDRRRPGYAFKSGVLNKRSPSAQAQGDRETGAPFEDMVRLCNETGKNMWINIPHLATNDFITKLAQTIRFGSDGVNPHTSVTANPKFAPLNSSLKVYVEFSNEIWSNGFAFPQGAWAIEEAAKVGLTREQFIARRFSDSWRIFQQVFGGTARLVRVAAIHTANDGYTRPLLKEMGSYGVTLGLSPAVRPDVLAVTTYFGNGIQDFVLEQGFATNKLFNDPYWTSALFIQHRQLAFAEWRRRMLAGDSSAGAGPDATSLGGGFSSNLRTLPKEELGFDLPIIAYEGGPSLFTDSAPVNDQNARNAQGIPSDDFVTTFVEAMNRDPLMKNIYDIHLNLAKSKALWTHTPYTDALFWSRFGQWGHLETFDQNPLQSPKYSLMLEHFDEFSAIRHIDTPLGPVPQFGSSSTLRPAIVGQTYSVDVLATGGNGALTVKIIGSFLDSGLTAVPIANGFRVSGKPSKSQKNFIHARVVDADGDPAWQIFTLESFGGPGTLVQSNFRGTSPALNRPFAQTHVLSPQVTWSGWQISRPIDAQGGVRAESGDDAFVFSLDGPSRGGANAGDSTLSEAIAESEFLTATVTPVGGALDLRGAEVRFLTKRRDFHAPRGYALMSSIGGFTEAAVLLKSVAPDKDDFTEREHIATLPSTSAFQSVTSPIEFRIYLQLNSPANLRA
ncbi:MAG TPA: hypothetical protein VNM92_16175 [Thermoanaerobaculia bacterium]|nr:hypothetical protein [Thermoanaerobaculia bacterium]